MRYLAFVLLLFVLGSCKKNRFKKSEFLESLYDLEIKPEVENGVSAIETFNTSWANYVASPTLANLDLVKTDLQSTVQKLEEISIFNLGDVSKTYVYNRMFKTKIDTALLIDNYNEGTTFTSSDVTGFTNPTKGIYALEYLLYSSSFRDSTEVVKFQSFFTAMQENLLTTFQDFQTNWETYRGTFIEQTDEGVGGSYNIVVNRVVHVLEDVTKKRITEPLDLEDPILMPGFRSNQGVLNVLAIVSKLKKVYYGNGLSGDFNSISVNVRKKNKKLSESIDEKFEMVDNLGLALTENDTYYFETSSGALDEYNTALKELLTLIKIDVIQELGIILTFGDTDGD
ncbi:MAG: hypothetical protein MK078_15105 [Crocinitomicaceae bacterium]|nr:hypothetical protein [Crocinitomicaceae bacterium]